jgi:SAM-dependent methyltransferase
METDLRALGEGGGAEAWDDVLARWKPSRGTTFLRRYSDAVNASLVREWLGSGEGLRVLKTDLFDEAVGAGIYPTLRERASKVVGIDVSATVLAAASQRFPDLEVRQADVRKLEFADCSFDAVLSNSTLDHFQSLEDVGAALRELRRVLVPRGCLLVTLDNGGNPLVAARNALPNTLLTRTGLTPYPTGRTCGRRGFARLLSGANFEVEAWRAVMHFPRPLARALAAVGGPASPTLLRAVLAAEVLSKAPTRYVTGQFVAAVARRA